MPDWADRQTGEPADSHATELRGQLSGGPTVPRSHEIQSTTCINCGFEVPDTPSGCKDPCANCGFVYPLGDCSD